MRTLEDIRFPKHFWWMLTPVKLAAAIGLIVGIWIPALAALTSGALVVYFIVAMGMHIRARDYGRNLFVNATGMLVLCTAALVFTLIQK